MMQNLSRERKNYEANLVDRIDERKVKWNCVKNIYDNSQNIGSGMRQALPIPMIVSIW